MASASPDDALLEAGRQALGKFGYHGLTAERIAQEAGLSRVTLHRRGVTKEIILAGLTTRAIEAYRAALWPALTADGPGRVRLEQALNALCGVAEEHLEVLIGLREHTDPIFHDDPEPSGEIGTRDGFTAPLAKLLRDGIDDGSLRPSDPDETAMLLFNVFGSTYVHLRSGHRWDPERTRRALVDLALHGLLPPDQ